MAAQGWARTRDQHNNCRLRRHSTHFGLMRREKSCLPVHSSTGLTTAGGGRSTTHLLSASITCQAGQAGGQDDVNGRQVTGGWVDGRAGSEKL